MVNVNCSLRALLGLATAPHLLLKMKLLNECYIPLRVFSASFLGTEDIH